MLRPRLHTPPILVPLPVHFVPGFRSLPVRVSTDSHLPIILAPWFYLCCLTHLPVLILPCKAPHFHAFDTHPSAHRCDLTVCLEKVPYFSQLRFPSQSAVMSAHSWGLKCVFREPRQQPQGRCAAHLDLWPAGILLEALGRHRL